MSTSIVFSHDCIILDACCAINLHGSGHMEEILQAIPGGVALAIFVLDEEILRSNLQPFIAQGLIRIVSPASEAEENALVNFAVELDDGEAVTGAIAIHRHWSIATDDRKARNEIDSDPPAFPEPLHPWGPIRARAGCRHAWAAPLRPPTALRDDAAARQTA